jgi:hypothetical protein
MLSQEERLLALREIFQRVFESLDTTQRLQVLREILIVECKVPLPTREKTNPSDKDSSPPQGDSEP